MTQFQHTLRQLLTGAKTETSRIVKPDERWVNGDVGIPYKGGVYCFNGAAVIAALKPGARFVKGKDYAIVPARGVKSVGRFRVEAIWRQDVRTLTPEQTKAEGFLNYAAFMVVWCKMHDPTFKMDYDPQGDWRIQLLGKGTVVTALEWLKILQLRPDAFYQAWRMTISVLWETVDWDAPAVRALQIEPHTVY